MFHRHHDADGGQLKPGGEQQTCGAPVDQASAAMDLAPHCAFCHQPLPAQPRARF